MTSLLIPILFSSARVAAPRKAKVPRRLLLPAEIISVLRTYPAIRWKTTLGLDADTRLAVANLDLDGQVDLVASALEGLAVLRLDGRGRLCGAFHFRARRRRGQRWAISMGTVLSILW
ncbi:hypothetical protein EON83_08960 [bacterium]|nr:MAG: hypothetical protein EON83_08960 [bacterium]